MEDSGFTGATTKVFYTPLEAAVRWAGLCHVEAKILELAKAGPLPAESEVPHWSRLRLSQERIHDALVHGDLDYGLRGSTCHDTALLQNPHVIIRHVDLKAWMHRFYPSERPDFLFDAFERHLHPAVSLEAVQALLADREALKTQLADRVKAWDDLQAEFQALNVARAQQPSADPSHEVGPRSETTYLNIVGGLLALLLGNTPNGESYSSFDTHGDVVAALTKLFGDRAGMSRRTLWDKFAQAKRQLEEP